MTEPALSFERREIARILALPHRAPLDCDRDPQTRLYQPEAEALASHETERYTLASNERPAHDPTRVLGSCACGNLDGVGYPCVRRLLPSQAWFLRELRLVGGALGYIPVAGGKTFAKILAPLALPECRHAVLLIKPDQRLHYRTAYFRLREHFRVPKIVWDGDGAGFYWDDGGRLPVLRLLPYSRLSRPDASELLESLNPDAIFADEAHCLSDRRSRRTARWLRFMARRRGRVVFAGSSGSLVRKKLDDVAHLALFALGGGSPYPLARDEVEAWGAVLDPSPDPDRSSQTFRSLLRAFSPGGGEPDVLDSVLGDSTARIREGLLRRAVETPGVVSARVSESTASISFFEFRVPLMPPRVAELLADVRNRWVRPDGEEFQEAIQAVECAREVACGFHYYWHFFDKPDRALVDEWFAARKDWCREVRQKILEDIPQLDSSALLENAAVRAYQRPSYSGDLPVWQARTWFRWTAVKDQIRYEKRTQWLDEWLVRYIATWARENTAIIWYQSDALGKKIAEISGLPCHGGGPGAEARIQAERGDRSIIVSIKAHGEGRDLLQYRFFRQLVPEPPSSGDRWQQLLGRLCRPGQPADTVETWVPLHVYEHRDALRSARRYAEFDAQMSPNRQLFLAADFDFTL